jgi:hypothetical protein
VSQATLVVVEGGDMREQEAFETQQHALQNLPTHPTHGKAIRTYLAGFVYAESRPQPAGERDEPQPVDEPAPPVRQWMWDR